MLVKKDGNIPAASVTSLTNTEQLNLNDQQRNAEAMSGSNAVDNVDKDMKGSDMLQLQTRKDKEQFKLSGQRLGSSHLSLTSARGGKSGQHSGQESSKGARSPREADQQSASGTALTARSRGIEHNVVNKSNQEKRKLYQ